VDDQKQIVIERKDDALADSADAANRLGRECVDGRIDRAQDERAVQREPLEAAANDMPCQRLEVDDDVGELGNVIS